VASRSGPSRAGWPLLPATDGEVLVLVHGRASPAGGNALLCVEPPGAGFRSAASPTPRLRWGIRDGQRLLEGGRSEPLEDLGGPGFLELQPGPLVLGDRVVIQARERSAPSAVREIASWLLALDLRDGRLLWKRFLTRGVELTLDPGRLSAATVQAVAGQPLARVAALAGGEPGGDLVFAGTNLGVGVLVEAADGRLLWSLKSSRRPVERSGWMGFRPPAGPGWLVWAPADGEHLYRLRGGPDLLGEGLLLRPPRARGESRAVLSADERCTLDLGRAGARPTVSRWTAATGGRRDSLYFALGEAFAGRGLASGRRVLVCTDRALYLLDRERENLLIDSQPLEGGSVVGGSVHARGDRVLVLGADRLWLFGT